MSDIKRIILGTVEDLVARFLYYDRKEDEDLPEDAIEEAIKNRDVSVADIVARFEKALREGLGEFDPTDF